MAELPHFCGPDNMGIGWTETTSCERTNWMWVQGEREFTEKKMAEVWIGDDLVWRGKERGSGVPKTVTIGDCCIPVDDFNNCGEDEPDDKKISLVFENEVWEGRRNPKMVLVVKENEDEPGAGSHARLVLEDFTNVPYKYPAGLVWCGTSLSDQSLNVAECNKATRFHIKKVKAFTLKAQGAKYKPHVNVEAVLKDAFEQDQEFLVIEVGVNEITNLESFK